MYRKIVNLSLILAFAGACDSGATITYKQEKVTGVAGQSEVAKPADVRSGSVGDSEATKSIESQTKTKPIGSQTKPEKEDPSASDSISEQDKLPSESNPEMGSLIDCQSFDWLSLKDPSIFSCFSSPLAVFEALPDWARPYWVLMKESRSQQPASIEQPRIIINSPTADFYLAVSTSAPKQLEVILFDYEKLKWNFLALDYSTNPATMSNETCQACHHENSKPIWQGYGGWQGAVAEDNDLNKEDMIIFRNIKNGSAHPLLSHLDIPDKLEVGDRPRPSGGKFEDENNQVMNFSLPKIGSLQLVGAMAQDSSITDVFLRDVAYKILCDRDESEAAKMLDQAGYPIETYYSFNKVGDSSAFFFTGTFSSAPLLAARLLEHLLEKRREQMIGFDELVSAYQSQNYRQFSALSTTESLEALSDGYNWASFDYDWVDDIFMPLFDKSANTCSLLESLEL